MESPYCLTELTDVDPSVQAHNLQALEPLEKEIDKLICRVVSFPDPPIAVLKGGLGTRLYAGVLYCIFRNVSYKCNFIQLKIPILLYVS